MSTPLVRYMDAVVDALLDAGVGVRDHEATERCAGPYISIDLDPVSAVRQPVMVWTPTAGWRVAVALRGKIRPATIRYVGITAVPSAAAVAAVILRWTTGPDHLQDTEPAYPALPRAELDRRLTRAAR